VSSSIPFEPLDLSAAELVLDLLVTHPERALSVQALARAAEVMGIATPSVRVALTRLLQQGRIEKAERGRYEMRAGGNPLQHEVEHWFDKERRLRPWSHGWIVVHSADARLDRTSAKHHAHALQLQGFMPLASQIWVRPDNLADSVGDMRQTLLRLGLASGSAVFRGQDFDEATTYRMMALWDVAAISAGYQQARQALARSMEKLEYLPLAQAACETLLIGRTVIRSIVRDPLLPEEILPSAERRALLDDMRHYQDNGKRLWLRVLDEPALALAA
jgi:phenylacetic acid degradation operon negative regulatory protein